MKRDLATLIIVGLALIAAWLTGAQAARPQTIVVPLVVIDTVPFPWDSSMCAQHDWMEGR